MMDQRTDLLLVDALDLGHGFGRERRQIGSTTIFGNLLGPLPARNRTADRIKHQDPAKCELGHRRTCGQEPANLLNRFKTHAKVDARKCLAYVECFSVSVEVAMVISGEGGVGSKLAGEQTACQRHPSENADLLLLGSRKEEIGGSLAKRVEDDLHGLKVGILDGPEGFLYLLHADAVVADFARLHEIIE
jgi:hypothetical protein